MGVNTQQINFNSQDEQEQHKPKVGILQIEICYATKILMKNQRTY